MNTRKVHISVKTHAACRWSTMTVKHHGAIEHQAVFHWIATDSNIEIPKTFASSVNHLMKKITTWKNECTNHFSSNINGKKEEDRASKPQFRLVQLPKTVLFVLDRSVKVLLTAKLLVPFLWGSVKYCKSRLGIETRISEARQK